MIKFDKPDYKITECVENNHYGRFELDPLERGFGTTIGNALRRVMLSSLPGSAVTSVKIAGVMHEFQKIDGVKEDVTTIILNLKSLVLINHSNDTNKVIRLVANEEGPVTAGQIAADADIEIVNPDLVICHLDPSVSFQIELTINKGRGYVPAEENMNPNDAIDVIAIDSIYTPIVNVKYFTENYRVEQKTDYEKLVIEITTDGSILPKDALKEAAKILIHHFLLFSDEKIALETTETEGGEEFDEEVLRIRQLLKTKLVDLDLSVRARNCLKSAEVETIGELVRFNKTDLLKFRNFGKKSLTELDELLANHKLNFGMDISKYKLDKE